MLLCWGPSSQWVLQTQVIWEYRDISYVPTTSSCYVPTTSSCFIMSLSWSDVGSHHLFFWKTKDCIDSITITVHLSALDEHIVNRLEFGSRLLSFWHQGTVELSDPTSNVWATELGKYMEFVWSEETHGLWIPVYYSISQQQLLPYDGP